jgi:hypothetical protein
MPSRPETLDTLGRRLVLDELFDLSLYQALHARSQGGLCRVLGELIPIEAKPFAFWQRFFGIEVDRLDCWRRLKLALRRLVRRLFGAPAGHLVLEAIEIHGVRKCLAFWGPPAATRSARRSKRFSPTGSATRTGS